ncbi:MAG: phosphoribosyl-AMP cyclohydrolase [Granulosicoccaceae bacterium]
MDPDGPEVEREFFYALEGCSSDTELDLSSVVDELAFDHRGLLPVITQDSRTKQVLMFAWVNRESLKLTIETQRMTYWSRSRQQLWMKGEISGNTQRLVSMSFDCDGDVVLCQVESAGPACHTGRETCFYLGVDPTNEKVVIE